MWWKPKILFLHVPIRVNMCENVSEMNKEAKWTECGCRGGCENCVQYFSRNTQKKEKRRGTAVAQWLRCCATNRKVAGSIPAGVIGIFY